MRIADINLNELEKLSVKERNEIKVQAILDNELISIPSILLPDVFDNSYYFVSYSHLDYKKVYVDILSLQEVGLNIWYDRDIPAGKDWKEVASEYMFTSDCKGIIFYLSENSLVSPAIINEIEYARKIGKPVIVIMLPFEHDYVYKGESTLNKCYSAYVTATIIKNNTGLIDKNKVSEIEKLLPESLLYLRYDMNNISKAEKIMLIAPEIPAIDCQWGDIYEGRNIGPELIITRLVKTRLTVANEETIVKPEDHYFVKISFLPASFANAPLLEEISFPKKYEISIDDYAFYGCKNLSKINIEFMNRMPLGEFAFAYCSSLQSIVLPDTHVISKGAFSNCMSLRSVKFTTNVVIDYQAFMNDKNLEEINLENAEMIDSCAFENCTSLKVVRLGKEVILEPNAFEGCESIETIYIQDPNVNWSKIIEAFDTFKEIYYVGTKEQFGYSSSKENHHAVVHCSDGDIKI